MLIVSCSKDKGTGPTNEEEMILPLAVGNEWIYVDSESDSINLILEIIDSQNVTYNNENIIIYNLPGLGGSGLYLFYSDSDLMATNETMDIEYLFLKYPVEVGDEWYNPFEGGTIMCLSTNQSIDTPAGNFNCLVYGLYEDDNNEIPYTEIYCYPNIGFIAIHSNEDDEWSLLNHYSID